MQYFLKEKVKQGMEESLCDQCGFASISQMAMKLHIAQHSVFPCTQCDTIYTRYGSLWNHVKYVHGQEKQKRYKQESKKYKCKQCDFHADKSPKLISHKNEVHGELDVVNVDLNHIMNTILKSIFNTNIHQLVFIVIVVTKLLAWKC